MMGAREPMTEATLPSTAVVEAVAAREGAEPAEVPEPLYESIDPDALDALVASAESGEVSFTYLGHRVTVDADGRVTLRE